MLDPFEAHSPTQAPDEDKLMNHCRYRFFSILLIFWATIADQFAKTAVSRDDVFEQELRHDC